jgi:hypothetical protein
VPLRTVIRTSRSGNCSTHYPLEITLKLADSDPVRFAYLQHESVALRRRDGGIIPSVTLEDSSSWTKHAVFDGGCRIALSIVSNEPDVNSRAEAEAIVSRLQQDVNQAKVTRDRLQQLVLYRKAYGFMRAVADNFRVELTNETLQELRRGARDAIASIAKLSGSCDAAMDDKDREHLLLLMMSLPQLGDAEEWANRDGGAKTLADFVGAEANAVLETVERLARAPGDAGASHDQEYEAAAAAVVRAEAKLALARSQLASWLTP